MANKKRVYWDSCNWISLINDNEEKDRAAYLSYIYEQAKNGEIEILTSTFTLAEVFKLRCENAIKQLPEEKDKNFEELLDQPFVVYVQLTRDIGRYARRLLRRIEGLKIPQDAIHLASAAINNVDELHTFDHNHLLPLDQKIDRKDGKKLTICIPPTPPIKQQPDLFESSSNQAATKNDNNKVSINHEEKPREKENVGGNKESINIPE